MKVFSKEKFNQNASAGIKKLLSGHLDALEEKEVVNGKVESYRVGTDEYYLYPVLDDWTKEVDQ